MSFLKKLLNTKGKKDNTDFKIPKELFLELAKSIIETNNETILNKYSDKLNQLDETPHLIFDNDEYYYDTVNNKFQVYRGNSKELKEYSEWFLLIDTLQFDKILWELDWKTDFSETNAVIEILAKSKNYDLPSLNITDDTDIKDLDQYFTKINQILEKVGLNIVELYIDSDSYVIGLIKNGNSKKIQELSKKCNQRIIAY